ncbi:MAG: HAD family hydrolase [Firmicutes bacterium HGW-Firmicutes-7]|nr:MAG: HAD family hydrolase [Firmicutes bacterium HGW-Firmicutes-7]
MSQIKYIFLDCMETIIDLHELPSSSDYAYWTYFNSGVEDYWENFNEFLINYEEAKNSISANLAYNEEYDIIQRIDYVVKHNGRIGLEFKHRVSERLFNTYWNTYKSKCFVHQDVKAALVNLSRKYKLVVISNFKVRNGIEELLEINKIKHLFDLIITSINFGWRKPDHRIYEYAINLSKCRTNEIVFMGDDYQNDYVVPRQIGIKSFLLNKGQTYINTDMVANYLEFEEKLT